MCPTLTCQRRHTVGFNFSIVALVDGQCFLNAVNSEFDVCQVQDLPKCWVETVP